MNDKIKTRAKGIDWDAQLLDARRYLKQHRDEVEYRVPGLHWPNTVTQLNRREMVAGYPRERWLFKGVDLGKHEPGKVRVVIRFFTKDKAGIYY